VPVPQPRQDTRSEQTTPPLPPAFPSTIGSFFDTLTGN
jgi:hypothetical protein